LKINIKALFREGRDRPSGEVKKGELTGTSKQARPKDGLVYLFQWFKERGKDERENERDISFMAAFLRA